MKSVSFDEAVDVHHCPNCRINYFGSCKECPDCKVPTVRGNSDPGAPTVKIVADPKLLAVIDRLSRVREGLGVKPNKAGDLVELNCPHPDMPSSIEGRRDYFAKNFPLHVNRVLNTKYQQLLKAYQDGIINKEAYENAAESIYDPYVEDNPATCTISGGVYLTWSEGPDGVLSPEMKRQKEWLIAWAGSEHSFEWEHKVGGLGGLGPEGCCTR